VAREKSKGDTIAFLNEIKGFLNEEDTTIAVKKGKTETVKREEEGEDVKKRTVRKVIKKQKE
jgi:hypothetical protein